jgi:UPF0042 nucleotide-binding protein
MGTSIKTRNDSKVIRIISCGFKHGAPPEDAALFIDCRGFINPHYDLKLRPKTGASKAVADYLRADKEIQALLATLPQLLGALVPGLVTRSTYHKQVKLVFACTGGKHRSRFLAITAGGIVRQLIAQHPDWDCRVVVNHRDQGCE